MAVYTKLSAGDIEAIANTYGLGKVEHAWEIAEGIENSNFGVRTDASQWIITITEKRVKREDLSYFMKLLEHMAARGCPVPKPQPMRGGGYIHEIHAKPVCVVSFLPGRPAVRLTLAHATAIGQFMAQMHMVTNDLSVRRVNSMGVASLEGLAGGNIAAGSNIAAALQRVARHWRHDLPRGHIHADMFPDNVFFEQNGNSSALCGVIDFFFAAHDILLLDIATAINAWCFSEAGKFDNAMASAIMAGYQQSRPLSRDECAALPTVLLGSALRFYLTRLYDWQHTPADALVTPKDPSPFAARIAYHLEREHFCDYMAINQ